MIWDRIENSLSEVKDHGNQIWILIWNNRNPNILATQSVLVYLAAL